jgi:catechol 2,3-dioxygenase-like lactoylglutathione lyase family enzyme
VADPVRFHLSLNVTHLDRSVAFFRTLFGMEPAKLRADYAKFEPDEPPLVLSLEPARTVATGGALNHVGLRMPDAKSLVAVQERLERQGVRTRREEGVECCYAKQTKFWLHDPDGNLWEVYTFDGDIEHRGDGQPEEQVRPVAIRCAAPQPMESWAHRMGEPLPGRIPLEDGAAAEVRLLGTFNAGNEAAARERIVAAARRVLAPGGRLFVHVLAGEESVVMPGLGGAAAAVEQVPHESEPMRLVEGAGFVRAKLLKYDAKPCFVRDGVAMREMQLEAFSPEPVAAGKVVPIHVMYKGPLAEVRDDEGNVFPRGKRVALAAAHAERLRGSALADQFVLLGPLTPNRSEVSCGV